MNNPGPAHSVAKPGVDSKIMVVSPIRNGAVCRKLQRMSCRPARCGYHGCRLTGCGINMRDGCHCCYRFTLLREAFFREPMLTCSNSIRLFFQRVVLKGVTGLLVHIREMLRRILPTCPHAAALWTEYLSFRQRTSMFQCLFLFEEKNNT